MERILVIDDERMIRTLVSRQLRRAGYDCVEAAGAADASAALATGSFDLALCDIHMPGKSGVDLAAEIARAHPDTAVVMLTGEDLPWYADASRENGADGYMLKPFRSAELSIAVRSAIAQRRHRRELETRLTERDGQITRAFSLLAAAR